VPFARILGQTSELGERMLEGSPSAHQAEDERVGHLGQLVDHDQARVQHGWRLVDAAWETSLRRRAGVREAIARVACAEDPERRQRLRRLGPREDMPGVEDLADTALDLARRRRGAERLEGARPRGEPVEQIAPVRRVRATGDEVAVEALGVGADLHLGGEGSLAFEGPMQDLLDEAIMALAHPAREPARGLRSGANKSLRSRAKS